MLRYQPEHGTRAALPAGLELSRRAYALYFGDTWRERMVRRLACRLPDRVGALQPFRAAWEHWAQIRMVLREACLCPALVIDEACGRIAVFTNLSNRARIPKPVVRIVEERLHLVRPEAPRDGDRLAAACVYWRRDAQPPPADWDDFSAIVVDCLVDDLNARRGALERIPPAAWQALEHALAQVPTDALPDLYRVQVPIELIRGSW